MTDTIQFTVYGKPATAGSKKPFVYKGKDGKHRASMAPDCKRSKPWMAIVQQHAQAVMGNRPLLTGPVKLDITFMFTRPKGHFGTGKKSDRLKPSAPAHHTVKPDATKLTRCLEDALTKVVWKDDSQVVLTTTQKLYGDREGAIVSITVLDASAASDVKLEPQLF